MKKLTLKNTILILTPFFSMIHTLFHGHKTRVDWYLFVDYTRRIDFAVMYLTTSINFIILSYCLLYPKGILKDVRLFIFLVCALDLIHYVTVSRLYFGVYKVFLAVIIFYIIRYLSKWLK